MWKFFLLRAWQFLKHLLECFDGLLFGDTMEQPACMESDPHDGGFNQDLLGVLHALRAKGKK